MKNDENDENAEKLAPTERAKSIEESVFGVLYILLVACRDSLSTESQVSTAPARLTVRPRQKHSQGLVDLDKVPIQLFIHDSDLTLNNRYALVHLVLV